jgi:hypothetical protein
MTAKYVGGEKPAEKPPQHLTRPDFRKDFSLFCKRGSF